MAAYQVAVVVLLLFYVGKGATIQPILLNHSSIVYNGLVIKLNMVLVSWTPSSCAAFYEVQGYTLPKISNFKMTEPDNIIRKNNSRAAIVPSVDFTTHSGDPIAYRIIALDDNSTVCSHQHTRSTFYRFDASRALETRTLAPNMKACYSIPSTNICPLSIRVIWPRSSPDLSCACPVYNSSAGGRAFEACQQSCPDSGYETMFVSNGSVCFVTSINQTIVHYECSSSICSSTGGECVAVVNTMLASHMILIAGPPNTPEIVYNRSTLYISAYSHVEFPVLHFDIEIADITRIATTTGRFNASINGTVTIPVPSSVCLPVEVIANATNAIGTNSTVFSFPSDFEVECCCYLNKENLSIIATEVSTKTATIALSCHSIGRLQFALGSATDKAPISLICGINNLTDLKTATDYVLYRRYTDEVLCTIGNFTTGEAKGLTTPSALFLPFINVLFAIL